MGTRGHHASGATRWVSLAIFCTFFGLYLLGGGRERPWADATPIWEVAESLVDHHDVNVRVRWGTVIDGRDGKFYDVHPLLPALVHLPGAMIDRAYGQDFPDRVVLPLASHLAPAVLGAWTLVLFFGLARRFAGGAAASWATVFVGAATSVLIWARSPYSEIVQTFTFTGFAAAVLDVLDDPSPRNGGRAGLWAGLLCNSKLLFVLSIPGVAAVFAWRHRRDRRALVRVFAWAALAMLPGVLLILCYNWVRWGSPWESGYGAVIPGSFWVGAWGLLLSPGKSIFFYSPPLLLALFGMPALRRRHPWFAAAAVLAILPVFVLYAGFFQWSGDWAWGPRYLTFAIPVLCVPLAIQIEGAMRSAHRWLLAAGLAAVLASGMAIQVIGSSIWPHYWIRIAYVARDAWLGLPRCTGDVKPPTPSSCMPDTDDLYHLHWIPAMQPILGQAWLLRHKWRDDPFSVAEADAPWFNAGLVRLPEPAESYYKSARIDWWPLSWEKSRGTSIALGVVMLSSLLLGAAGWLIAVRGLTGAERSRPAAASSRP